MLSRLLRETGGDSITQPMSWLEISGPVPPEKQVVQYLASVATPSKARAEQEKAAQAAAEEQTQQRVREARETGRREGEIAGRNAAAAEMQAVMQQLAASIKELAEYRPRLRRDAEQDLVRLALAIARKIVNRELSVDPDSIAGLARMGLEKLRVNEVMRVRVHPQHQGALKEYLTRTGALHIDVVASPAQPRGTLIIETTRGDLDVSADTQLAEIERGLTDRLR